MITLHTNLKTDASAQLTGYDFNSYCRFGEHLLACGSSALCAIGGDAGEEQLTNGDVIVTPIVDDVERTPVTFSSVTPGKQLLRQPVLWDIDGYNWKFRIENVDGCWFALKKVEALPINLSLGR